MKILGIPFSAGGLGKTNGCELAPRAIIDVLKRVEINESQKKIEFESKISDVDNLDISYTNELIEKDIDEYAPNIIIGGDHSITYSSFRAFCKSMKKQFKRSKTDVGNLGLVVFDAHPDMENNFVPPTHEDFVKVLIEEGSLKPENLILVGVRAISQNEKKYLEKKKITYFDMKKIDDIGKVEVCDIIMEKSREFQSFYVSLDIDVIDPAFVKATGYMEPGGLSVRDMIYFIQRISFLKNIGMVDLVEVNPKLDKDNMTVSIASKLIAEFF